MSRTRTIVSLSLLAVAPLAAQEQLGTASNTSSFRFGAGGCTGSVIYDTTRTSNQGAEITAAANGPATSLADLIVLGGTDRFVCEVVGEFFTLASTASFDLTMTFYTACSTSGAGNTPCGNGPGTVIGTPVTVTGITPPGTLGTIFQVAFPFPNLDLSAEVDNTISVSINASRSDVFWRIGETPTVGSMPDGPTSFVERCGSTAANNGCSRNFGVTNNFAMTIEAELTPVELESFSVN